MKALVGISFILAALTIATEIIGKGGFIGVAIILGIAAIIRFGSDRVVQYLARTLVFGVFTIGITAGIAKGFSLTGLPVLAIFLLAQWVIVHRFAKEF